MIAPTAETTRRPIQHSAAAQSLNQVGPLWGAPFLRPRHTLPYNAAQASRGICQVAAASAQLYADSSAAWGGGDAWG